MSLLNDMICSVHTTIYAEHLIFGNKISINISQVCKISNKFMNYDHHETKKIMNRPKMYKYKFSSK